MNLSPKEYTFVLEMEVRDYELDCEQIVNNANYLHYMEHTRHKFCQSAGLSFIDMHRRGIDAVVRKIEIEYLSPLYGSEEFLSCLRLERRGPRFVFHQAIFRKDNTPVAKAVVTVAVLNEGKLSRGDELAETFAKYI